MAHRWRPLDLRERRDPASFADPRGRNETIEWVFVALNSVEMANLPWSVMKFTGDAGGSPATKHLDELKARADQMAHLAAADKGS